MVFHKVRARELCTGTTSHSSRERNQIIDFHTRQNATKVPPTATFAAVYMKIYRMKTLFSLIKKQFSDTSISSKFWRALFFFLKASFSGPFELITISKCFLFFFRFFSKANLIQIFVRIRFETQRRSSAKFELTITGRIIIII